MDESGQNRLPLSAVSIDRNFKHAEAKPEESFRLVNEELQTTFAASTATFKRKVAKKNPSAPSGSLAFGTFSEMGNVFSSFSDPPGLDFSKRSSNVATVRSHPPLKASRSMYIVGPSLNLELNDTSEKLREMKNVELERSSTIDEEDSPSLSIDKSDELLFDKTLKHDVLTERQKEKQVDEDRKELVSDNILKNDVEFMTVKNESLIANPASIEIFISTIESPQLDDNDKGPCPSSKLSILVAGQAAENLPISSSPTRRARSPTGLVRPASPPARSVTPVSPVASMQCLASIEELDKSTSQDEDDTSDGTFEKRERHGYLGHTIGEAKQSPLNLDSSVEVYHCKSSLTVSSVCLKDAIQQLML